MRRDRLLLSAGFMVTLTMAAGAAADETDKRWYVAPAVSYIVSDDDRETDDGLGLMLGVGKPVSRSWNLELSGQWDKLEQSDTSREFKQRGLILDGLYFFNRQSGWSPYGVIGGGALRTKFAGDDNINGMVNVGIGLMKQMTAHGLSLRGDVRHRWDLDDGSINGEDYFGDWFITIALSVPLGAGTTAPAPAAVVQDGDGDGVPDDRDNCPDSRPGVQVDETGCEPDSDGDGIVDSLDACPGTPPGAVVDARGCEPDSDGDGVSDASDSCPDTPSGARVGPDGCEPDSDGDGVRDSADQCPDSDAGAAVDARGCEIPEVIILKGVNFNTGSHQLTDESSAILDETADALMRHPQMKVEVAGHTDNRGSQAFNLRLSQERAQAVLDYLVSRGVDAENITAKGYGPDDPIADNETVEGRAANRRVELHILSR